MATYTIKKSWTKKFGSLSQDPDYIKFWIDTTEIKKEKSKKTFRLKKSVQIKTKSPILPTGASMV